MVTAIVLLNVERDEINAVAERLVDIDGVSEVYSVSGRYDLVAMIRVQQNEDMAEIVTEHIRKIDGIQRTETMLAFRSYSRHDLEAMFSIGL
ncbi:MAG: Lrp/AsnC ligand binding domain-containing protein [Thermoflexales bacterium]|nr:Lrp/AsnC ligand binding domain-containing protein [Thermoflexales bacterium]